jgi:ABC-type Fe3+ transport system permease subunit
MNRLRTAAVPLAWLVRLALVLILLGLPAAGFLERADSESSPRFTWFYSALVLFDPLLHMAMLHSVVLAVGVTLGAAILGQGFALAGSRSRWARQVVMALAAVGLVLPPPVAALGLRNLADRLELTPADPESWAWAVVLGLAELPWAAAFVAGLLTRRLDRLDPRWPDLARLAGGHRGVLRAGVTLVRPVLRSEAARASSLVFLTTVCEPGGPLVLGQRRYLATQMVVGALDGSSRALVAFIALFTLGLGLAGFSLIRGWGKVVPDDHTGAEWSYRARAGPLSIGRSRHPAMALLSWSVILLFACLVLVPVVGLLSPSVSLRTSSEGSPSPGAGGLLGESVLERLRDGLLLGSASAGVALALACLWWMGAGVGPRLWSSRGIPLVPSGILAIAVLAGGGLVVGSRGAGLPYSLDPAAWLAIVLALTEFASVIPVIRRELRRSDPALADVARLAGAVPIARFWLSAPGSVCRALARNALALVWLTGVESQAALLLTPGTNFFPPGPALIALAAEPSTIASASVLGLAIVAGGVAVRLCGTKASWLGLAERS